MIFIRAASRIIFSNLSEEAEMDKKKLKKLLAGLSIAGLIAGGALTAAGCASTG